MASIAPLSRRVLARHFITLATTGPTLVGVRRVGRSRGAARSIAWPHCSGQSPMRARYAAESRPVRSSGLGSGRWQMSRASSAGTPSMHSNASVT